MRVLLLTLICIWSLAGLAQEVPTGTQQQLENLADEALEDDALLQQLEYYRQHPINLNAAAAEDLQHLRFLTDLQIASFLRYRKLFGKLIDLYELQAVPGFDLVTIQKIRPYVMVGPAMSIRESFLSRLKGGDQYALIRYSRVLERSKGYDTSLNTHYLGDAARLLFRYRYQYKSLLYYGLVADKDAGEQFFRGAQRQGFDFYSVHFFARNLGAVKALALGDYTVNLGQGLIHWQSLGFGKSAEAMNIKRQSPVLLPYRSAGEFYFNRGAAVTIGWKDWEATGFVSYKKFSGNLDADSLERFTSLGTSGYHRTKNEIADRNKLTDLSFGGNLAYKNESLKVGLNAVAHQFSLPLEKTVAPYNYFALSGRHVFNASLDYSYTYRNAHLFGEAAVDRKLHLALLQGLLVSVDKQVDISLLYRHISKSYQSLYGNAFTENTQPVNERGLYAGLQFRPAIGWQLAAYADFYQFDYLKYRVSAPSRGWDYMAQLTYTPDKKTEVYLRYRTGNKPINEPGSGQVIPAPLDRLKQNLRLHFVSEINPSLTLKGRTELLWFDRQGINEQEGFLSYIEVAGKPLRKLRGNVRLQYFETASYDSRIYTYESDVLYSYSIPAFYDKGIRYYLNVNYSVLPRMTVWLRFAQTYYPGRQSIGSGLDEISGNKRSEMKMQVRYEF